MKKNIEIKASISFDEYDIKVAPYLTYSQIQAIVDSTKKFNSWAERQQNIDMCILHFATDISDEEIEAHDHDYWLGTGIVKCVEDCIDNIYQLYDAIAYEESLKKSISTLIREIPEFNQKVDEVMKNASGKK